MNFQGIGKVLFIAILLLAALVIVPALLLAAWTSPAVLVCVCAGVGFSFGLFLKAKGWPAMMGAAGCVAAVTLLYVSAALGGGIAAWFAAFVATVVSTSLTISVGLFLLPKKNINS